MDPAKDLFGTTVKKSLKQLPVPVVGNTPRKESTASAQLQNAPLTPSRVTTLRPPPSITQSIKQEPLENNPFKEIPIFQTVPKPVLNRPATPTRLSTPLGSHSSSTSGISKLLVTPSTTRLLADETAISKPSVSASPRKALISQLPAPSTILPTSVAKVEVNPEIAKGFDISPSKKHLEDRKDRVGRNRQGFILSVNALITSPS